jgi:hypothetical protein
MNERLPRNPNLRIQSFFVILLLANLSCHLLTFAGAFASPSCTINSIVSSIFEIDVTDDCGMNDSASSASVGFVHEGCKIMIGFEVFFWRIWYFLSPQLRIAYPGVVTVEGEEVIVKLEEVSSWL